MYQVVTTRFLEDKASDANTPRRRRSAGKAVELNTWADDHGISDDSLTLQIDRSLDNTVWRGTRFVDRAQHFNNTLGKTVVNEIEKSLLSQESLHDFEARMLKSLGVDDPREPAGPLRDMETQIETEARAAWNKGMLALQPQGPDVDTILVWRSALMPTTTPECADRHGVSIDEIGEVPPMHWLCACDVATIPNPDSEDPNIADEGQAVLDTMAAERAEWFGSNPVKESRLPLVRWAQERRRAPGEWVHPGILREAGDNCGTGAGGFQAGNTCAKGEGSGAAETHPGAMVATRLHEARTQALDKAAGTHLRKKAREIIATQLKAVQQELAEVEGTHAGPSTVFTGDAAMQAFLLFNEADILSGAVRNLDDVKKRTWRADLEQWNRGALVEYTTEKDGTSRARIDGKFAVFGSKSSQLRGREWKPEDIASVTVAMNALPKFGDSLKTAVILLPTSSLSILGQHYQTSAATDGAYPHLAVLHYPLSGDEGEAGHTALHEFGHGVDSTLMRSYFDEAEREHPIQDGRWWETQDAGRAAFDRDRAAIAPKERETHFRVQGGNWGGERELFAEDFADAFMPSERRSSKFGNELYGNAPALTDTQRAQFRDWVTGRLVRAVD